MARKRKKPAIRQMAYSGVNEKELRRFVRELKVGGAVDVVITEDLDTMRDFPGEGRFYVVEYSK